MSWMNNAYSACSSLPRAFTLACIDVATTSYYTSEYYHCAAMNISSSNVFKIKTTTAAPTNQNKAQWFVLCYCCFLRLSLLELLVFLGVTAKLWIGSEAWVEAGMRSIISSSIFSHYSLLNHSRDIHSFSAEPADFDSDSFSVCEDSSYGLRQSLLTPNP